MTTAMIVVIIGTTSGLIAGAAIGRVVASKQRLRRRLNWPVQTPFNPGPTRYL